MPHATDPNHRPRSDRLENRTRLLDAYISLVSAGRQPSVEQVAVIARVGRTTAYRHFHDIAGLRSAAFREALVLIERAIRRVAAQDDLPICRAIGHIVRESLEVSERFALNSIDWPTDDRHVQRSFASLLVPLTALVRARQRSGELDPTLPAGFVAEAIVSLVQAAGLHRDYPSGTDGASAAVKLLLFGTLAAAPKADLLTTLEQRGRRAVEERPVPYVTGPARREPVLPGRSAPASLRWR